MTISHRFVLTGTLAGKTINLGGHDFIDGVHEFIYVKDGVRMMPSQDDIKLKAHHLRINYQAFPEGSPELAEAEAFFAGKAGKPVSEEKTVEPGQPTEREVKADEERNEAKASSRKQSTAARNALLKLSHENDEHWTEGGLPSVAAVREIAGIDTISRADIAALAPNLTREEAKKIAASGD